ncbi:MAG: aromatic-L-amino-acid/L-tryptophan decarboxylase [Acidimicrobiaceae bacterium]|nr:aromatic-L-amino-acid/L-tryptophan decarboxylase [Acidimicrobiaceae bacterium]
MTPEEFRRHGRALIDWIADYVETIERHPVASPVAPGAVRAALPPHPPTSPEPFDVVLADLDRVIVPGLTHWQHPSFFAYFPANSSYESILGELASAGLGVNGMLWATSPAATELERLMLDWMVDLLALPARFRNDGGVGGGVIQGTASEATLCAILAARERATSGITNRHGVIGGLVAYTTAEAHSSVEKGLRIAGIGSDNLRHVPTDDAFAMRPDALTDAIKSDRVDGLVPFLVVATAGSTSSMAFDPVSEIGEICRRENVWLHVDAAMAGIAALASAHRFVNAGLEQADSYCTNPHKWMGVNFDCDLFWVADRTALTSALSILPEYLRTAATDAGTTVDLRDWGVPLGRRFRALKLWFTIRSLGVADVQAMIERHIALAGEVARWVDDDGRFLLAAPPALNLVCFRHIDGDAATDRVITEANASGQALFTRTVLGGRSAIRFCVGGRRTEARHVEAGWKLLQSLA